MPANTKSTRGRLKRWASMSKPEREAALIALLAKTPRLRQREIADKLVVSVPTVSRVAQRLVAAGRAPAVRNGPFTSTPKTARTAALMKSIASRRRRNWTYAAIGEDLGITAQYARHLAKRQSVMAMDAATASKRHNKASGSVRGLR